MTPQERKKLLLEIGLAEHLAEAGRIAIARLDRNARNPGSTPLDVEPWLEKVAAARTVLCRIASDEPLTEVDSDLLHSLVVLSKQVDPEASLKKQMASFDESEAACD